MPVEQGAPVAQSDGQAPADPGGIVRSQVSPGSTTPFRQLCEQSGSVSCAPAGQQVSPGMAFWISTCVHVTVQPLPMRVSVVQGTWSSHDGGQAPGSPAGIRVSQVSPGSMRPLPQLGLSGGLPSPP